MTDTNREPISILRRVPVFPPLTLVHYDMLVAKEREPFEKLRALLQRVADFDFLLTLDATPTRAAREAYTELMVAVRLALREGHYPAPSPASSTPIGTIDAS